MTIIVPTRRFSGRVENYIQHRPSYPLAVLATLKKECQLTEASVIADIGSGTGILTELFLQNGNAVLAVEPNPEMRAAGERLLRHYPYVQNIQGTAEATTLGEASVDFVTAGQAFHWFDRQKTKDEFLRILKLHGWVVLVWNERQTTTTPFLVAYEQLLQTYATDYEQVNHTRIDRSVVGNFFKPLDFKEQTFANRQEFDFEGIKGRLLSSSYTPEVGQPNYEPMVAELSKIFQTHQVKDQVRFEYVTIMYYGQLQ